MNLIKAKQLLIATFFYVLVCSLLALIIQPFSIINFIGPAAGIASAFTIIWGIGVLFSIIIGTICFGFILLFINGVAIDFSILLIAILAISLQSTWTKVLTRHLAVEQRWLESGTVLFGFMLKIGPVAGLVSASASVVITILDAQILDISTGYVFLSNWVSSSISSVLFIPAVLFIVGAQQLTVLKRLFVVFVSILGHVALFFIFYVFQRGEQYQRVGDFDAVVEWFKQATNDEVDVVTEKTRSLTAFFKASDYVSYEEFTTFAAQIQSSQSSISTLGWVPLIDDKHRKSFERKASLRLGLPLVITQQNDNGQMITSAIRANYLPVYYIYPQTSLNRTLGLDLLSYPDRKITMERALTLNTIVASAPLSLLRDNQLTSGIFIFYPVSNNSLNAYAPRAFNGKKNVTGYVLAVVELDILIKYIQNFEQVNNIKIRVQDITVKEPYLIYDSQIKGKGRLSESITLDLFNRKWLINISEAKTWINQPKSWQIYTMLAGGALGSFLFQFIILMVSAYSVQLSHQVMLKTRELMLAKKVAEKNNRTKSHFLKTLGSELKSPVDAINYFVRKFHRNPTFAQAESSIGDIANASENLTQLADTVMDLTKIEADKINAIQLSRLDFHPLLDKIETLLNASNQEKKISFTFFINDNVPPFIESDELRIQQLIMALAQSAPSLLNGNDLSISVTAHAHQLKRITVFFVVTKIANADNSHNAKQVDQTFIDQDLSSYSTSMAMVKELCQLFEGDINLNQLASGQVLISASIKVDLAT